MEKRFTEIPTESVQAEFIALINNLFIDIR